MSVPTEAEIRAAAQELGLADEHGDYRRSDRNKIAAALQRAALEPEADDQGDSEQPTTVAQLAAFRSELVAVRHVGTGAVEALLVEVTRHLLRTQGLRLAPTREETTPL